MEKTFNKSLTNNQRVLPGERHDDPPSNSGRMEFLVPKDAQCSETCANTNFRFI